MKEKVVIGITCGDINGVSLQILIQSLPSFCKKNKAITAIVFGSKESWDFYVNFLILRKVTMIQEVSYNIIKDVSEARPGMVNIFNCIDPNLNIKPGTISKDAGLAATESLHLTTKYLMSKKIDTIVTMPVNKSNINFSKVGKFIGHTEYFRDVTDSDESLMLLMADDLKIATVTNHLPISDVSKKINKQLLSMKIELLIHTLKNDFSIKNPRIAILGLNPHNGDGGLIGSEETSIINPIIQKYIKKRHHVLGPFSADSFFGNGLFKNYDAVLSMYHDQGLIPFKMQSFNQGVNFTAGLNIVRTSPDHGPAYDIVGTNDINHGSFLKAIFWAEKIYRSRLMKKD